MYIRKANNELQGKLNDFLTKLDEEVKKSIEKLKMGDSDDFESMMQYIVKSNTILRIKMVELEKELDEFRREFYQRELTQEKFQGLLMKEENTED